MLKGGKYFIILSIILCAFSCKKEESPNCIIEETYPIDICLTDYFFETGSYWVYQDSLTQELDSVWVIGRDKETLVLSNIYQSTNCPNYNQNIHQVLIHFESSSGDNWSDKLVVDKWTPRNEGYGWEVCNNLWRLDSLDVSDTTFFDVLKLQSPTSVTYLAPKYGVIRTEEYGTLDTTVTNLIRFNVSLFPFLSL